MSELNIDGFCCVLIKDKIHNNSFIKNDVDSSLIQFHFVLKGNIDFSFNEGNYQLNINERKYLTLYNPQKNLPLNISSEEESLCISILVSIDEFHKLFSKENSHIPFLSKENINQKYYQEDKISHHIYEVLQQLYNNYDSETSINQLYLKAKIYELFSIVFQRNTKQNNEQCPFIMNDEQVRKIKLAKEIIISRFNSPPTLIELSEEINLSLKKLKQGFKEIYGKPVFQYLLDYKMNLARKLLLEGVYNVNEISLKLGYSTASHFIAAFKKRFDLTPRKYILNNY
jgi:AraC-like DNA-binding protein